VATDLEHPTVLDHPFAGLTAHWRAWRRREELDTLLAGGADPCSQPELACRARQLTGEHCRHHLAVRAEAIVAAVDGRSPTALTPDVCAAEVRAARRALLELAARLREPACAARGVVMARRLLTDPTSPVYAPAPNDELWRAARAACRALGGA
jgi:hypothetical protein